MKAIILTIIITIAAVNSQTCMSTTPSKSTDCTKQNNSENYCCYLNAPNLTGNSANVCLSLPKTAFTGDKTISYNGYSYFIECGVTVTQTPLQVCGPSDAIGKKDCMTGASFSNSCCWDTDNKKCFWLGTKYSGETKWAGLNLDCSSSGLTVSIMIILSILSIIF